LVSVELVLKNGKILTTGGIFEGGLAIEAGKIVAMAKDPSLPSGDQTIDAKGNFILPGFIDAHSHVRGMGRSDYEDFTSGTMAAASSGVTTIMEMPITLPPTSTVQAFKEKREAMSRQSLVNFALYAGAGSQNIQEIAGMAREGAVAFKTFMHPPPAGREQDFWGFYVADDGSFLEMLRTIAQTGSISAVHAENPEIVEHLAKKLQSEGRMDLSAYLDSRPGITESEGISRAAMLASEAGVRIHICHVCAKEALEIVRMAKGRGQMLTAETCPHYLTFTHDEIKHLGPYAKINPPIRNRDDRDLLWEGIRSGVIDLVASDHGPFPKKMKDAGLGDIWKAYMGAPGLDAVGPVMLTHVNNGLISLKKLSEIMSENVAKVFGLYPNKGVLSVGSDADMVVVDMNARKRLVASEFHTKAREIALLYNGFDAKGIPNLTVVNGTIVMRDGEIVGKPGTGRFVRP
jgi:allantoinase